MKEPSLLDEHFLRPRNAGMLEGADLAVRADNPVCGDILHLYVKLDRSGRVDACAFQAYGCPAAIAAGSLLTETLRGRSRSEAAALTEESISAGLGGLTRDRLHAAILAHDALAEALKGWKAVP